MSRRSRAATGVLAAALVLAAAAAPAHGDGVDDLPEITSAQLAASVHDLQPNVSDIRSQITPLEREISAKAIALNSDVLFAFDEARISPRAQEAIGDVVEDIPQGAAVTITGYTDDVGEDDYNQELSTRRARAVEKAVAAARPDLTTTARGRGSADPVEPNSRGGEDNPAGRAKNRRVEISYG